MKAQSSEFSEPVGEHFAEADLIQKLLSLEPKEDFKEDPSKPDLLQQLLLLEGQDHGGDTKLGFTEADLVQELMVLEQEGQQDVKDSLSDGEHFQDLHAIDHKAFLDQDVKDEVTDDNMTEEEDEGDEKKENEDHRRDISTTIYKSRLALIIFTIDLNQIDNTIVKIIVTIVPKKTTTPNSHTIILVIIIWPSQRSYHHIIIPPMVYIPISMYNPTRLEKVGLGGLDPMYVISCTTNEVT